MYVTGLSALPTQPSQLTTRSMGQSISAYLLGSIDSISKSDTELKKKIVDQFEKRMTDFGERLEARDNAEKQDPWPSEKPSSRSKRETSDSEKKSISDDQKLTQCREAERIKSGVDKRSGWLTNMHSFYAPAKKFYQANNCQKIIDFAKVVERKENERKKALDAIKAEKNPTVAQKMKTELKAQAAMEAAQEEYAAALVRNGAKDPKERPEEGQIKRLKDELNSTIHNFKKAVKLRENAQYVSTLPRCLTKNDKSGRLHTGAFGIRFCAETRE